MLVGVGMVGPVRERVRVRRLLHCFDKSEAKMMSREGEDGGEVE